MNAFEKWVFGTSLLLWTLVAIAAAACTPIADSPSGQGYEYSPYYNSPNYDSPTPTPSSAWTAAQMQTQVTACVTTAGSGYNPDPAELQRYQSYCQCIYKQIASDDPDYSDYLSRSNTIINSEITNGTYSRCYTNAIQ